VRLTPTTTPVIGGPRNGGSVSFRSVLGAGPQGLPGPGAAAWTAAEVVTTGAVRQAPDGSRIKSTATRTTRATFDATEQTFWKSVLGTAGTMEADDLSASYVPQQGSSVTTLGVGYNAGLNRTSGVDNTAFGYKAARETTTGSQNTVFGYEAFLNQTDGNNNTAIGWKAARGSGTTFHGVTAVGFGAAQNNQTSNTVAVGATALQSNTTGTQNTAVGTSALQAVTISTDNTAMGYGAGKAVTGNSNTAFGNAALFGDGTNAISGDYNIAVGTHTGRYLTTGSNNTLVGSDAAADPSNPLTTGGSNVVVGQGAGWGLTSQVSTAVAVGQNSKVLGDGAVALGQGAEGQAAAAIAIGRLAVASGANSLAIGRGATASGNGSVAIGRDSSGNAATSSIDNDIVLGTSNHRVYVKGSLRLDQSATGSNTVSLGSNSPAHSGGSLAQPYAWFKIICNDGATVVVPGWRFDA
jgi:hypothetical protein